MLTPDRAMTHAELDQIHLPTVIAVNRQLWAAFYFCPTTNRILPLLHDDDKVLCHCGRSNTAAPWERTHRTHTHQIEFLNPATVELYVDQLMAEWRRRAAK